MLGDNLCYYVTLNLATTPGILIDVSEPEKARNFLNAMNVTMEPTMILTTHKHHDHSGGNIEMKQIFPNI